MEVKARIYDDTGYQELFPDQPGPNPSMPVRVIEVTLTPDNGSAVYTVGRLFFPPDFFEGFGRPIKLVLEEE